MKAPPCKILLVEPDARTVETIVTGLTRRFDARITCVATAAACLDIELATPHDLVIAEMNLADARGTQLAERLTAIAAKPIILMTHEPTCGDAIAALRLGISDLLEKPFSVERLLDSAALILRSRHLDRALHARHRKLRTLVREAIRERRDLNRRIDLICRDLVGAHRRLVGRVLSFEKHE